MMTDLKGKKILYITPKYYGYEEKVFYALKEHGAEIFQIYENMEEVSFLYRFAYVYLPEQKPAIMTRYYIRNISKISGNIDFVFVIRGASITVEVMEYIKGRFPDSKYIMYQWDGVKNNPNALTISKYFDSIFTFDVVDADEYKWNYRPLFFTDNISENSGTREIDIAYICSLHSDRVLILNKLKKMCKERNLTYFFHMYSKKIIYYKRKYLDRKPEYLAANNLDVKFNALSIDDTYEIYCKSKAVVDYTHPGQTGYTMRTIECLGNCCKLITNNKFITEAEFYNANNIYVYDEVSLEIPQAFLDAEYVSMDASKYYYYSLDGWVDSIFAH